MFCKHCGKEVPNESKFCPYCGEDLTSFTTINNPIIPDETIFVKPDLQEVENTIENTSYFDTRDTNINTENKKGSKAIIFVLIPLLLIGLLAGAYFLLFGNKNVNTSDFVTVTVSDDLDGYASAQVNIDYKKLNEIIGDKNMQKAFKKISGQSTSILDDIKSIFSNNSSTYSLDSSNFIEYKIENDKNLHNNDEVVVEFVAGQLAYYNPSSTLSFEEICKLLKINMDDKHISVVKGLQEGVAVEATMPNIENYISFVGSQGKGKPIFNTANLSYTFNNYKVTFTTPEVGEVTKNGAYVGNLLYFIEAENPNVNIEQLKQGDVVLLKVQADDTLAKELAKDKLVVNTQPISITVNKLGESLDPSKIATTQLLAMSQPIVINARNAHMDDKTAILEQIYTLTNKTDNSYGLAYIFKTTDNNYCMTIAKDIAKDPSSDNIGFDFDSFDVGKSLDLANALSAYDYKPLGNNEVLKYKYAVGKNGIVTNKGVRVRNGAGTKYTHVKIDGKLANYEEGEVLEIIDEAIGDDNNLWYRVNLVRSNKTYSYWISGMYLQIIY